MSAEKCSITTSKLSISRIIGVALPLPAFVGVTLGYILPKHFFWSAYQSMPYTKSGMLPFDNSTFHVGVFRYWRNLAAPAFTVFGFCSDRVLWHIVSADKFNWLTNDPSALFAAVWRNSRLLSAPAMAVTVWDFVRGLFRGMITHVDSLLSAIDHSAGLFTQPLRFIYWFAQV